MTPLRLGPGHAAADFAAVHTLLHGAFAYMEGRIDPPSSLHRMTPRTLAAEAIEGELWVIPGTGHAPTPATGPDATHRQGPATRPFLACMILHPAGDHLALGKLAVAGEARGRGLARSLVEHALSRARAHGLPRVLLHSRVELVEVHARFRAMGFVDIGRTAHPGHTRATSITFARDVSTPLPGA